MGGKDSLRNDTVPQLATLTSRSSPSTTSTSQHWVRSVKCSWTDVIWREAPLSIYQVSGVVVLEDRHAIKENSLSNLVENSSTSAEAVVCLDLGISPKVWPWHLTKGPFSWHLTKSFLILASHQRSSPWSLTKWLTLEVTVVPTFCLLKFLPLFNSALIPC